MIQDIYIFDDFIPKSYSDEIEFVMLNICRWQFKKDVTIPESRNEFNQIKPSPAFGHLLFGENQQQSEQHIYLLPMIHCALQKINMFPTGIQLGRSFLQLPLSDKFNKIDPLHVDSNRDHIVVLYYVLDSDGDTIITSTKRTGPYTKDGMDVKDHTIIKKVTPKKGRVVIFNGALYHTAEQPSHDIRCVINYNVMAKEMP